MICVRKIREIELGGSAGPQIVGKEDEDEGEAILNQYCI